jgi:hypothetical protein
MILSRLHCLITPKHLTPLSAASIVSSNSNSVLLVFIVTDFLKLKKQ